MKILRTLLYISLLLATGAAQAELRVAIIVNASNSQDISLQDVANIYHDRIITWENGQKIDVFNLPTASKARGIFTQTLLGMSAKSAAAEEANRQITNTSRNPQLLKREHLVLLSVSSNKNAIAYVNANALGNTPGIRVLFFIE
jgi:ABC-type phosphate transport system substrate-binding protein